MSANTTRPEHDDLLDIQGNVVGFLKDHQRFLFIRFPDLASGQQFVAAMAAEVNNAEEIRSYNRRYSEMMKRREDPLSEPADWVNVALTAAGLELIGAPGIENFPEAFRDGMAARAQLLGDVDDSGPSNWVRTFTHGSLPVHAMVIIAADLPDLLEDRTSKVRELIQGAGVLEDVGNADEGNARPGGREHFGFKDGISQPNVDGLVTSSGGGTAIAAGEFLIGYEDQDGRVSGGAVAQPNHPTQPGDPGYPAPAPVPPVQLPAWARNGSFLVYRRLRQNVGGFQSFVAETAARLNMPPGLLAAKILGRWPSGTPLEHVPGRPPGDEAGTVDPALTERLNDFKYQPHDADGHLTPRAAHIRKANPRDSNPAGEEETRHHRLLRRGIVYGPDFHEAEPTYPPSGAPPVDQDRGLLFLCYQADIEDGFEFVQTKWINSPDFPSTGDGMDPIVSQSTADPPFPIPADPHLTTQRWVVTTGGDYLFSPSISALRALGDNRSAS
jgi:Dyp-type peroxidase family